jgi:putative membrane protein
MMSDDPLMNENESINNNQQPLDEWQRLSALSILFFIGKVVGRILKDAIPSLAPLAIVIFNSDNKTWMLALIGLGVISLVLISSFLQFWFFKFKQLNNKILINDGVFKKNHRVIQFDRIQNINILQPLYFKPFNLVTLQIETAGAKGNEADLAGISNELSTYIKDLVLKQQQDFSTSNLKHNSNTFQSNHLPFEEEIIVKASIFEIVKYGLSSNGVFWFFVFLAPVFSFDEAIEKWFDKGEINQITELLGGGLIGNIVFGFSIFFMVIILMFSFSIIGAVFRYFNYQLSLTSKSTIKRVSGLLTRYEESLKHQKIQSFITQTNFIGKWLNVNHITLGQVSTGQNNN